MEPGAGAESGAEAGTAPGIDAGPVAAADTGTRAGGRPRRVREPPTPRQSAIGLLSRREHSSRELKQKLVARGSTADEAVEAVEALARDGWQSDERYAEAIVRQRVMQGYGPLHIRAELSAAGLDRAAAAAALDAAECDWSQLCVAAHARRFNAPANAAERQKQWAYLSRRGFDSGHIRAALRGDVDGDAG